MRCMLFLADNQHRGNLVSLALNVLLLWMVKQQWLLWITYLLVICTPVKINTSNDTVNSVNI